VNPIRVHIISEPFENNKAVLEENLAQDVLLGYGEVLPDPPDYQFLVAGRPPREFLEKGTALETLIIPWAGLPTETRELLEEFPHLAVHNLHHNAGPTAELALALLFAVSKRVIPLDRALRTYDWRPRYAGGHSLLLRGKRALIVGYGEIGRRVGEGLRSLGVRVMGIKRDPTMPTGEDVAIFPPHALQDLLSETDFLFLTLPFTPDTEGLIGEKELALLPSEAILINVSRGPIVDQEALYCALQDGKLFGAGLDVWYHYPEDEEARKNTPPADYPFHRMDCVVLSPHRGGSTRSSERLRMIHLSRLLNAAARGEEMPNQVDIKRGY
jgi:phosphoglycerate dehydrogenase-like enzyme